MKLRMPVGRITQNVQILWGRILHDVGICRLYLIVFSTTGVAALYWIRQDVGIHVLRILTEIHKCYFMVFQKEMGSQCFRNIQGVRLDRCLKTCRSNDGIHRKTS